MNLRRRPSWILLGSLVAVAAGVLAFVAWRPPAVPAVEVHSAPLVRSLQFSARVSASTRVDIGATLTGRVTEVRVREGMQVAAGDVLVRLESDEAQAALLQAQASERQAQARLAALRGPGRSSAAAAMAQAEANLAAARADLARTEALVKQQFLSPARLDEARRALAVTQAQVDAARTQQQALDEAGPELAQASAQLAAAQGSAAAARARVAQAALVAPAAAQVLSRQVEPGQIVQPGRALLSLALQGPLQLVAQVDERYLEQLQPGQPAAAVADAFPGQRFDARVQSVAPVVDAQRGAIEVKLALPKQPPAFLRNDMTLSVDVQTARREKTLAVPLAAVRVAADGRTPTVLVFRDGRAEEQQLQLGLRTLESVEITAGLQAGETVLLGSGIMPGMRVRPDTVAGRAWVAKRGHAEDAGTAVMNAMGR